MRNRWEAVEGKTLATPGREGELNVSEQSKEGHKVWKKTDKDGCTGTERWDGWSQSSPLSAFESTRREDLQREGVHVHTHIHWFSEYTFTHTHGHRHTNTCPPCTWTGLVGKASPPPHAPKDPPAATACFGTAAWTSPAYCEGFPENTHRS